MPRKIEPSEFAEWLLHPVTKEMRATMAADLQRLKDGWATGGYAKDPLHDAYIRGQCVILQQFIDLEHSDIESE